jgi:uncharacterized protein YxjI
VNITINQHRFGFRSEYDISGPKGNYHAKKKLFSLRDRFQIMTEDGSVVAKMVGGFYLFRARYDFLFSNGKTYRFRCQKFWKPVFVCDGDTERFVLYEHKRLNYSVFQNDVQIAAFSKNRLKIGKGDRYEIRINNDANFLVVVCLALTVDASENEQNSATITFDFGNLGPEDRPFDESWEPR